MSKRAFLLSIVVGLAVALLGRPALADPVQRVQAKRVCMVNDTVFPKDQIPVTVDGKTYFGCCEMCKGRLGQDAAIRQATDPVSGKPVDKASAVIGARPDGSVLYFESEKTLAAYQKRKSS
jgi:YHS domain-containing protein